MLQDAFFFCTTKQGKECWALGLLHPIIPSMCPIFGYITTSILPHLFCFPDSVTLLSCSTITLLEQLLTPPTHITWQNVCPHRVLTVTFISSHHLSHNSQNFATLIFVFVLRTTLTVGHLQSRSLWVSGELQAGIRHSNTGLNRSFCPLQRPPPNKLASN